MLIPSGVENALPLSPLEPVQNLLELLAVPSASQGGQCLSFWRGLKNSLLFTTTRLLLRVTFRHQAPFADGVIDHMPQTGRRYQVGGWRMHVTPTRDRLAFFLGNIESISESNKGANRSPKSVWPAQGIL